MCDHLGNLHKHVVYLNLMHVNAFVTLGAYSNILHLILFFKQKWLTGYQSRALTFLSTLDNPDARE